MKTVLLLIVVLPVAGWGESFPLAAGNQWLYRGSSALQQVEVARTAEFQGRPYSIVQGLSGHDLPVRLGDGDTLLLYDPELGREAVWARMGAPEGESYTSEIDGCPRTATVSSNHARYAGPAGNFDNAIEIMYSGESCGPVGLRKEVFVPGVGLVQRTTGNPAGDLTIDLIYASIAGLATLSASEVRFALTLDRSVYLLEAADPLHVLTPAPKSTPTLMTARLTLSHSQPAPLQLLFACSQTFELVIRDAEGREVYRWSAGRAFTALARTLELPAGEKNWPLLIPLLDREGNPLAAGRYTAEAWLVTREEPGYRASVGFEVRRVSLVIPASASTRPTNQ